MSDAQTEQWFEAVRTRDAAVVRAMLASGVDCNVAHRYGWTALHWAAGGGHAKVVDTLLRAGADIEARDAQDCTPLHWAAQLGDAEIMEVLICAGADIEARDAQGKTPRDLAPARFLETLDRLVAKDRAERVIAAAQIEGTSTKRPRL